MMKWEKENGAKIPESYKEWLRFTGQCRIAQNTAIFWGPNKFHSEYVPDDLVVIGELIGDGERVCFSKAKGMFVSRFEGKEELDKSFDGIIKRIVKISDFKPILSSQRVSELLARYEEDKRKGLI